MDLNFSSVVMFFKESGRLFHSVEAEYSKVRSPYVFVDIDGTVYNILLLDRSVRSGLYRVSNSVKYDGARS